MQHYSIVHDSRKGARSSNEDRVAYSENQNGAFLVVADGLGGHAKGDMAAQITVDCMIESFDQQGQAKIEDPAAFIVLSMTYAHSTINRISRSQGLDDDMPRSTCVACLVQGGYAYWGHVGDSRLYLFGDSELLTRTIDHTTTDHLHYDGVVDEHVQRFGHSQLLRCIGGEKRPVVSLGAETHLGMGDTILMCTDGVWRAFKEPQLVKYTQNEPLDDGVDEMLSHAQRFFRDDCDNLTALMFRWEDKPTQVKPLMNLSTPELDQESLWLAAKYHKEKPGPAARKKTYCAEDIDSVIAEIESFIKELDSVYAWTHDKTKID